jgi:hypothetical protein
VAKQRPIDRRTGKPQRNGAATAALVVGLVALSIGVWSPIPVLGLLAAMLAVVPAVVAIALGHVGLSRSRQIGGIGRVMAIVGLCAGYIALAILVGTAIWWVVGTIVEGF